MPMNLGKFGRRNVIGSKVKVTKAGDGLSDAQAVEPVAIEHEEEVFLVLRTTCDKVTFEKGKDGAGLLRVHTLATQEATIVDESLVGEALEKQRHRIAQLTESEDDDESGEG